MTWAEWIQWEREAAGMRILIEASRSQPKYQALLKKRLEEGWRAPPESN